MVVHSEPGAIQVTAQGHMKVTGSDPSGARRQQRAFFTFAYRDPRNFIEALRQLSGKKWRHVLDNYKRDRKILWQRGQQRGQSIRAACGGPNGYYVNAAGS